MIERQIRVPGADHPITITMHKGEVSVRLGEHVIAKTNRALALKEGSYPAVYYIPREDADMSLLQRSDHSTYCPYKGDASYFSIPAGGENSRNAVWSYERPYAAVAAIKDHLAFYPKRVDAIETQG